MLPFIFLVVSVLAQQTFAEEPEKIVGGTHASLGQFPHQVSLRYNGNHVCGGTIVESNKIVTAAHCVDGMAYPPYYNYKVATGTIQSYGGQIHDVAKVVMHPQYGGRMENAWVNDVAVIMLASPMQFNQYQKPIALATSPPTPGQQAILSGWGKTSTNGPLARNLLYMHQNVMSASQCQQYHSSMPLTSGHLCMLNRAGIGACQGDSGGPLISNGQLIGITSWVLPCARGAPDVYTNAYKYRDFINAVR